LPATDGEPAWCGAIDERDDGWMLGLDAWICAAASVPRDLERLLRRVGAVTIAADRQAGAFDG